MPRPEEGSVGLHKGSRDDGHLVDLVGVAAAGEVVDRGVQAEQDGAVGLIAAETLAIL